MKLLIVRHGDPDYDIDSLTEKGWKEVEYLSQKLSKLDVKAFYVSPLGRAKDTAAPTLKKMGRTATECEWLKEFPCQIWRPDVKDKKIIAWDWLPQDWMADERFFQYDHWFENEAMQEGHVKEEYDRVIGEFDKLLAKHGYEREGHYYKVNEENNDTIIFFCHFWIGVCTSQPSAEYLSDGTLAWLRGCPILCDNFDHRRTPSGNCCFPYELLRRYFPPLCQQ